MKSSLYNTPLPLWSVAIQKHVELEIGKKKRGFKARNPASLRVCAGLLDNYFSTARFSFHLYLASRFYASQDVTKSLKAYSYYESQALLVTICAMV